MAYVIESVFDLDKIGGMALKVGGSSVSMTTADYTHQAWNGSITWAGYVVGEFAPAFELVMQIATGDGNYSVSYDAANAQYTIAHTTTPFALDFTSKGVDGMKAMRILGFSGDQSSATSHTSDVPPWYTMTLPYDCLVNEKQDYEDGEGLFGGNQNGIIYGDAPDTLVKRYDFRVSYIPRASLFKHLATYTTPWTWEDFTHHHRLGNFFVLSDGTTTSAHKLHESSCSFKPVQVSPDYHGEYHLDLMTYIYR